MIRKSLGLALPAILALTVISASAQQIPYLHAPAVNEYARHDPKGVTILPDGRLLKPLGKHVPLAKWPHGLAMSADGARLLGVLIDVDASLTFVPHGRGIDNALRRHPHGPHGIAYIRGGSRIRVAYPRRCVSRLSMADRRAYQQQEETGDRKEC